ncbi:Uncharacterised protein [Raoultella terrigena]|uniref:Uncharacterized protein n=1 Tax=Raoultella terrigena TaxID=577 RepID=A0A4V6J1N0_RAOTE|nr:Uncharacterised protein [Raoultella terrigena]
MHLVDKKSGKVDGAWELAPNLKELRLRHLEPKRDLIVSVDPTLTALNTATFGTSFEKTIATRDVAPSIGFASRGSLLPGKVVAGLPVMALNVDNVDVNFFRIKPESLSAFVSQWEYRNSLSNWESDELLKMADLVYSGRFDLNPARNTREKLLLPLADIKPLQQPGVYVAVMNQAATIATATPRRCLPSAISASRRIATTTGWTSSPKVSKTARAVRYRGSAAQRQGADAGAG